MNYYKIGEFASLANVTIRTIRYYDQKGILKPSKIDDNGYRLYTDNDLVKLQQILSLKYLGFSLDEIFTMTRHTDKGSLLKSLSLQETIVNEKINHLMQVQSSINETKSLIENDHLNWDHLLKLINLSTMNNNIIEQYKNATNVEIRIRLHELYSTNKEGWFNWLFKHYELDEDKQILEIGCGNGELWKNKHVKGNIILSDISQGMIEDAKNNLGDFYNYMVCDAHDLPFEDKSMDIIIANHVLFYLKDTDKALHEIKRVLKNDGIFYVSTYGKNHMKEIRELAYSFNKNIKLSSINLYEIFGLENGENILKRYFNNIKLTVYNDSLEVDNIDEIANYIISCHGNQLEYIAKDYEGFNKSIKNKMQNNIFKVSKNAGLFICKI